MSLDLAALAVAPLQDLFGPRALVVDAFTPPLPTTLPEASWVRAAGGPEEALGRHLAHISARSRAADSITALLASPSPPGRQLAASLTAWLAGRFSAPLCAAALAFTDQWFAREGAFDPAIRAIPQALLPKRSQWTILGDGWGAGSDIAALHHFIASGEDLNALVLATDPAGSVGAGAAPRRDVGLYALNYGGVYVASCCPAIAPAQFARALAEADAWHGPSVVLALVPPAEGSAGEEAARASIASGVWPLYRFDPAVEEKEGGGAAAAVDAAAGAAGAAGGAAAALPPPAATEAFSLDSEKLRQDLSDFLARSAHLSLLAATEPALPEALAAVNSGAASGAAAGFAALHASFDKLMGALQLPPMRVLFGSDGGNAEGVAKRVAAEAAKRGFAASPARPMDAAADLAELIAAAAAPEASSSVYVLVVGTAGQGEFPSNARAFWKALTAASAAHAAAAASATPEAPLAAPPLRGLRFAVVGLGDSNYWPRKEQRHFFNKASVDLFTCLSTLGAFPLLERASCDDQSAGGFQADFRRWAPSLWAALGVGAPGDDGSEGAPRLRAPEAIKPTSNYLRGTIAQGLKDGTTGALSYEDTILTKFHGIYQQDDRDLRGARKKAGLEPAYSFMVRVRIPGGVATPAQYLVLDALADSHANGTIRVTTRQAIQYHGIIKGKLKPAIAGINRALMDTLAACGDVNRNVMCSPNPDDKGLHAAVLDFSRRLSDRLSPRTTAYHEIWLDDALVGGGSVDVEPIYGPTYLPRKFKIAVAIPPHNDVDVFAHDLGFIAHAVAGSDGASVLEGFTITAGGGMGMTHNAPATFPRLAEPLCFATVEQALAIAEACVTTQRDFGDRTNRRHARFKYTVDDRGMAWLAAEVEGRVGFALTPPRPFSFSSNGDALGWTDGPAGTYNYTLFVQNGRVKDAPGATVKAGLRAFAELGLGDVRFTPNQNVILACIPAARRAEVDALLAAHGMLNKRYTGLRLNSMACVAMPTCGLSLAEAERYLPSLLDKLDEAVEAAGLRDDAITIRMTGCPNGCARPYVAEVGLVGRSPGIYNLYLGAGFHGERLNTLHREDVGEEAIVATLAPLFKRYAGERGEGEKFGDWLVRGGVIKPTVSGRTFHEL